MLDMRSTQGRRKERPEPPMLGPSATVTNW
jgi:hypothetical protein